MNMTRDIVAKRIEQVLIVAAILAYWAPAVSFLGSKVEALLPVLEASSSPAKNTTVAYRNTTIAYEVIDKAVTAATVD
jgi:hypothetical protein